jgi:hypothetical protein
MNTGEGKTKAQRLPWGEGRQAFLAKIHDIQRMAQAGTPLKAIHAQLQLPGSYKAFTWNVRQYLAPTGVASLVRAYASAPNSSTLGPQHATLGRTPSPFVDQDRVQPSLPGTGGMAEAEPGARVASRWKPVTTRAPSVPAEPQLSAADEEAAFRRSTKAT